MKYKVGDVVLVKTIITEIDKDGDLWAYTNDDIGVCLALKDIVALVKRGKKAKAKPEADIEDK